VGVWVGRWGRFLGGLVIRPLSDGVRVLRRFWRHPQSVPGVVAGGARWVLPVGLSGVFVLLFAIANPVIAKWTVDGLREVWELLKTLPEWLTAGRVAMWVLVMGGVWGVLRVRAERTPRAVTVPPRVGELISARMIVRCLAAFNVVFAVQTAMDGAYLWMGAKLPAGMTYAEYAHRGAYPLVATALLAGLFVMWAFRAGGAAQRSGWARGLVMLWIVQNVMLMISTFWRLMLYVGTYGLTYWRVSTMVWVGLVAAGLVWIVLRIVARRGNAWVMRRTLLTAAAVLYGCCFVNWPRLIADFNVGHCAEVSGVGVPLDVWYLEGLGPEVLPGLDVAMGKLGGVGRGEAVEARWRLARELREGMGDWRGWTWRVAELRDEVPDAERAR